MRRGRGVFGALATLGLLAACSGGSGSAAKATTTTVASTTTTLAVTTTTTPEDAVKQAWTAYWSMIARLADAPDGSDPELAQRAAEPLLSALRDDFTTQKSKGQRVLIAPGARYDHRLDAISLVGSSAVVAGCKIDDSTTVGPSGEVIDDSVVTSNITATFVFDGSSWKATDVKFTNPTPGISGCANK